MPNNRRFQLRSVRCSYPHLFQPRAVQPGTEPKYSCAFLVPKNDPILGTINQLHQEVLQENFGANPPANLKPLPIKDGDSPEVGHPGHWVINASAKQQPIVVDQAVQKVLDPQLIYAGCRVVANLSIFAYRHPTGSGTTFGLDGVQFERDDERLDGRPTAEQMFNPIQGAPTPRAQGVVPAASPGFVPTSTPAPTQTPTPDFGHHPANPAPPLEVAPWASKPQPDPNKLPWA